MSRNRSIGKSLQGGKLCIFQSQTFAAGVLEIHMYARINAAAFQPCYHAITKLLMEYALTDAPT